MRSESEKVTMKPLKVVLGTTTYELPAYSCNQSEKYRELVATELGGVFATFKENHPDFEAAMNAGVMGVFLRFPKKVQDLVFQYTDLPKDKILDEASEEQVAAAFLTICGHIYPYLAQLGLMTEILRTVRA